MAYRNLQSSDFAINREGTFVKGMGGKPGILLVWAGFCGHCTRFKPTYAELQTRIGRDFNVVALEDKNMSSEVASNLRIEGYPTLKFFDNTGKIVSDYNGNRDIDSLLGHICKFYHTCTKR